MQMLTRGHDMKSCGIVGILLYAVCVQISALAATDNGPFKSYPAMTALPVGVRITFEVAQPTDVEISVLDAGDRVIRHLAAGVLGGEFAPPEPLQKGMRQSIQWDGRDDSGQPAAGGPLTVRIRTGMQSRLGGLIGSATSPPVIWLSNVGNQGQKLVRIENRGEKLVVTDEITVDADAGFVKLWTDPLTDDVYVNNGWNRLTRYNGLTGESGKLAEGAIDLAVGPDRNLYMVGRTGWKEPVYRCDLQLKPVPFTATGKPTAAKEIYGRYGMGWSNKGLAVAPDGRIFVRHMYDWTKYHVLVFRPDGSLEEHDRVAGGIVGPVDDQTGGLRVDRQGNIYLSMAGHPKDSRIKARRFEGCVVKVASSGGGLVAEQGPVSGMAFAKHFFEGAITAYPHLAPRQDPSGCVCKEARFDVDDFGRIYVPNIIDFCVRVYDNAGNLIHRFGRYGNADSTGSDGKETASVIPLGWPMTCGVNRHGRVYIADVLNHRIVRADLCYDTEVKGEIK